MTELDRIRKRAEAATPGPWSVYIDDYGDEDEGRPGTLFVAATDIDGDLDEFAAGGIQKEADADFIAAARTDIPLLLRIAEAADGALRLAYGVPGALENESDGHVPDEHVSVTLRRDREAARELRDALAAARKEDPS